MAKDETASKRAAKVARDAYAFTNNLQRAFDDLLPKLKDAYGQPAVSTRCRATKYARCGVCSANRGRPRMSL